MGFDDAILDLKKLKIYWSVVPSWKIAYQLQIESQTEQTTVENHKVLTNAVIHILKTKKKEEEIWQKEDWDERT